MPMADRISNLPDEVLGHILSFLPTEDVVATTTVLSKRWSSLWLLVPTLDFDYQRYISFNNNRSHSSFVHFVYATILRRGFQQPIKTFRLVCDSPNADSTIWLNAAMQQRQVQNLEIRFLSKQAWVRGKVPFSIFSYKTLVFLKMHRVSFHAFPSPVDLPSLKALHLFHVALLKAQYILELLHGCPVLENLEAKFVLCNSYTSEEDKLISLPKLVRADLAYMINIPIPVTAFCNVEFLRLVQCFGDVITIPVLPNLTHLDLSLGGSINWNFLLDMLNHCPQLQTFVLNLDHAREAWPNPDDVPECFFSSQLKECFLTTYTGQECEMRFAKHVLQNSTSLRTMTICCMPNESHHKKLAMILELTKCPRGSTTCELLFK